MNLISDENFKGLRKLSILATSLVLLLFAGLLVLRRPAPAVTPEPRVSEYSRYEPEVRPDAAASERSREEAVREKAPELKPPPSPEKKLDGEQLASRIASPIAASAGGGPDRFVIRDRNASVFFTDSGITYAFGYGTKSSKTFALKWGLEGANEVRPRPEGEGTSKVNRISGDASKWQTGLSTYTQLIYDAVRPGVEMVVESRPQGLKYSLQVAPRANTENLKFRYEGAQGLQVAKDGQSVQVVMDDQYLTENQLVVWQETPGGRVAVEAHYEQSGVDGYSIQVGTYDPDLALMIDPVVAWSTFLGGKKSNGGSETGYAIAADTGQNSYLGGNTGSVDFPTLNGFQTGLNSYNDGFICKFGGGGNLIWSTLMGGSDSDSVTGLRLDPANNVVICGYTNARNFPTTAGTYQQNCPAGNNQRGFVAKLNGATGALMWSTYLSGPGNTGFVNPTAVAVDGTNNVYVTGYTNCTDYPMLGAAQNVLKGGYDAFLTKLDANGANLVYSTYWGGGSYDYGNAIVVDANNSAYISGEAASGTPAFPTTAGAYRTVNAGQSDAFAAKFSPGGAILWCTLVGGASTDISYGIGLDNSTPPFVYIAGYTYKTGAPATDYPTTAGSYHPTHNGYYDGFVTKIKPDGTGPLVWSTLLGGTDYDKITGLVVSGITQDVYVAGLSYSTTLMPTTNGVDTTHNGGSDAFIARFSPGGGLLYGTYLGGNSYDIAQAVAEYDGWVWVTGQTSSVNYPFTAGAYQPALAGGQDAFVTRVDAFAIALTNFSTFLGGAFSLGSQNSYATAADQAGNVYVCGSSYTVDYPVTPGALFPASAGYTAMVVTKIANSGAAPLLWSTYFGGMDDEEYINAATTNSLGELCMTGYSYSLNYPVTGGGQPYNAGGADAIVTRFKNDGTLFFSTYIGGTTSDEYGYGIACDSANNVYIVGDTYSTDYPTFMAYKPFMSGSGDCFISKIAAAGTTLVYSTYFGGTNSEHATSVTVDSTGAAIVVGWTYSNDYPILGGLGIPFDAPSSNTPFVTKFIPSGANLAFSTFFGGSSTDYPYSVAVDNANSVYVGGITYSSTFPVPNGYQTLFGGSSDGFVMKLNSVGNTLIWSTFLGGSNYDNVSQIAVDGQQNVYATGSTSSTNFPMTPPLLTWNPPGGGSDAFAVRINAIGNSLSWATYLGGALNTESGMGITVGPTGNVTVLGDTNSPDFPVAAALQPLMRGSTDFFIVRINNEAPTAPSSLTQYRSNGTTVIATGGATNETTVVIKGISSDAEGDRYKLQVEVRPIGTAFTSPATIVTFGVDFFESALILTATTATVTVGGRTAGTQYHWQARSVDFNGVASAWTAYGANLENPPNTPAANDFQVDTTLPLISITAPNGTGTYYTNLGSVALGGTSSDNVGVFSVGWANAANSTSGTATGTTTWSVPGVSLVNGSNVITMTATDTAGNVRTAQINVIQDTSPPTVTITGPTNNPTYTTSATQMTGAIAVTGTYSDNLAVTNITWANSTTGANGTAGFGGGTFTVPTFSLNPGLNTITVTAFDNAGNSTPDTISVTSDPGVPLVTITTPTPASSFATSAASISLGGTASDAITSVTQVQYINTTTTAPPAALASGTITWSTPAILLADGNNVINVIATDAAGNQATDTVTVIKDNLVPSIQITGPTINPTFITNGNSVNLAGTASDAGLSGLVSVGWANGATGGFGTATGTTSWSVTGVGLASGANLITLTATDGAGNTATDTITVTSDPTPPLIAITGPTSSPTLTTSGGSITLTGTASDSGGGAISTITWATTGAVAPNSGACTFFVGPPGTWSVPNPQVTLAAGAQTITITATDTAGNTATDTIVVTRDTTNPTLAVTTPAVNPFYTTSGTVALGGTASDASGITQVQYRVNGGGLITATGTTTWSVAAAALAALPTTNNTIDVIATDGATNTTQVSITVIRDTINPAVSITTNGGANFSTNATPLALAGTSSDNFVVSSVQWQNNGGGFNPATGTAPWSASIPLSAGSNAINVKATDAAGNSATTTITVTLDQTSPTVSITGPSSNPTFSTTASSVTISGNVSDAGGTIASVNWSTNGAVAPTSGTTTLGAGTFTSTAAINLAAGAQTITVTATDSAGNTSTDSIIITRDNTNPTLSISTPGTNPAYTTSASIALAGTASDNNGLQIVEYRVLPTVSFTAATGTTSWSVASAGLLAGSNTIEVRATDLAGNTFTASTVVVRDNVLPVVTISNNGGVDFTTNSTPLALTGTSSDDILVSAIAWSNNGSGYTAATGTTSWSASIPLSAGTNTITVRATDAAGNISTDSITVTYDSGAPLVAITSPTVNPTYVTGLASVTLGGTASDASGIQKVEYRLVPGAFALATPPYGTWTTPAISLAVGANTIEIKATDNGNNPSTTSIVVTRDNVPPTVAITGPTSNPTFATNGATLTLSGTVSDSGGGTVASVTWNNPTASSSGGSTVVAGTWTATSTTALALGSQVITVTATDSVGNISTTTLTVVRDTSIPTITIASPGSPHIRNTTPVTVTGTASDGTGSGVASVNWSRAEGGGATGTAGGTTSWSAPVPLVVGTNTITFTAVDAAGNTSTGVVLIATLDQTAPTLQITGPTSNPTYATNGATVQLSGTVSDAGGGTVTSVTWNNPAGASSGVSSIAAGNWTATTLTNLAPGVNTITVTALDSANNSTQKVLTVTVDTTNPTIVISSPASPAVVGAPNVAVSGTAADALSGVAQVNWTRAPGGVTGAATGTTAWSAVVPLVVGVNTIIFTSVDAAGNVSADSVLSVTLDQTGPTVAITGPVATPTFATKLATLTLSGTVNDVGGGTVSTVTWNNPAAGSSGVTTLGAGTWTATTATNLVLGSQVITVTATDSVNNVSTTTLTVFYDNTNPTVAITSPTSVSPFTTGANPLTMGGSAGDPGGSGLASVTWANAGTGGSGAATGLTSWSANIPLNPVGANDITITATDNAGNTATATLQVFLNSNAPTVTITAPTTNSTYFTSAATIALGGTAIDSDGQIVGVAYTLNGGGSVAASGTFPGGTNTTTPWSVASISLVVGSNTIVVTATDNGATTGSDTITVIRDNTNPTAVVTTNGGGDFTTNTSPVVLSGTAADLGGSGLANVTWTNAATSGTGPAGSASPWTGTVPLTPGANLITFTATDNAGNTGTDTITVTYDVGAPVVTITSPSASGTFQTATTPLLTLAGTSSDNVLVASVQYQINGGIFTPTGGTVANWSVASIALNSGVNTINVKATDSAGNTTTASIAVTLDNTNPAITISSPTALATFITNTTPIILAGTASDNLALANVTWSNALTGGTGTATGTTAWTATGINLLPGANAITVKATDTLGNQSSAVLTVTYDSSVPTLAITAPTAAATYLTTLAAVTLSGTAGDNISVATVTALNSANGSVGTPSGTTAWSVTGIALVAGTNVITVTATDTAGNTATKTLTVTRDNTLPTVAIATPTAGPTYLAGTSPVNLAGTASDNVAVASVQWSNSNGGGTGTASGTTSWTASVGLNFGSNIITVTATDTAGNVSVAAVLTVTYDASPPAVSITTNGGVNFATNSSPAALAGTSADAQGIASVKWSNAATGGTGTATGTAPWSTPIPLAVGGNAITITATDSAGNTAAALITITLDTTVPTVTITGPTTSPATVTTGATIALNGTFADNISVASVVWSTDGAVAPNSGTATLGAGTWTVASIDLAAGSQILTILATDSAGNTSTDTITVTRDNTIPTIAVTSPTGTGTYVTGAASLIIGGTAADDLSVAGVAWTRLEGGLSGAAAGTTTWSATVPLQVGTNTFTFTASDSAGNPSAGAVIVVTRDNTLPAVQITGPTPNPTFTTGASPIAISGTATDADGISSVTWFNAKTGGSAAASYAAGAWTASVPLAIGVNTITVSATDTAGNIATDAFDVTLDISPPVVTITAPTVAPTYVQSGASIALGGAASDNTGVVSVTALNSANGSTGTPSGTTAWTVSGITLVAGPNVITVTATDNAGNTASSVLTVTRDGTPPVLAITGPTAAPTYITNSTPILLTGTSSDNVSVASISWSNSLGGSGAATGTAVWSASVPLFAGNNVITVTSTDTAGGTSTAVITVTYDNTPPAVAITAPTAAPTYVTNIAPVLLGGTASDGTQLQDVTWSNAATGGSGTATGTTTWSASVPLTNGLNTITVSANDTAGNSTTAVIAVTFDAAVPTVTISSPTALPNFLTSAVTIALGGTASDNVGVATVTCVNAANGAIGVVTGTTSWTVAPIALAAGDNAITLTVTDTAGNTSSDTITVKQDSTAPVVLITIPNSSGTAVTNGSPLAIGGTASDNVGVASIAWSNPLGVPTSGSATGTTAWSALVPVAAGGPNTITVTATDTAGNTSTATLTVSLDNTAPTINTTGPTALPNYSTATSSVTISGNANDAGGLSTITWVNGATGATGTATGTSSWTAAIALTPGINVIVITATDAAGNINTSTITVIHDTQSPTITISTPSSSASANSPVSPITIGGSASDNVGVTTVTWTNGATGGSGTATGTTAWSTSVPLVEGNNQITVTAVDDVGNSSSDTITITYDPTLPTINITTPTMQATYATTTTPLDFSGSASDNLVLTGVTWANVSTGTTGNATGTTTWNASVPLQSGINTIVFTASDSVGNLVTDSIDVTYDVTPPVVVIVTPAPPTLTTQTRPLLISGTASDNIGVTAVTWSNSLTGASGAANFADPNWDASVPLIPGTNVITIRAIDALGNIGTAMLTVDYSHETVVPAITINTPTTAPTFTSPSQLVTVAGTATDNVGVTAVTWVNRTTAVYGIANGTTAWSADIPLADGMNLIEVTASDDVGNTVFASITITFLATIETNVPTITITAPTTNDTFNTTVSPLHLEANAIDDVGVASVHWTNQGTYGDGSSGWSTFWYASIPLASGSNIITVTAIDTSGNTTTDTITVNYNPPAGDPVPPLVNIVTPLASGTVNTTVPLVSLTGTASDNNKVDSVTFSNSTTGVYATAAGTSSWSATNVVLDPGVNVITARAIDPAGNVGQATLVVVYTPPAAAKPVAPVIPAGMCGCTGLEPLLVIGALWLGRRFRRRSR